MSRVRIAALIAVAALGCKGGGDRRDDRAGDPPAATERPQRAGQPQRPSGSPGDEAPGGDGREGSFRTFPSVGEALAAVLAAEPRVLGIGEYHQTHATAAVKSTLRRFTGEVLSALGPRASDLVVETWVRKGRCGAVEARVNQGVTHDTQRPPATERELGALARRAFELGVAPHALEMSCQDYEAVQGGEDGIDYEVFLELIARRLGERAARLHEERPQDGPRPMILVYGGALHNDRAPIEGLESWSYGQALAERLGDGYVELDLLVPEMIAAKPSAQREPWYPIFEAHAAADRVLLIERGPRSFVLVLERGVPADDGADSRSEPEAR